MKKYAVKVNGKVYQVEVEEVGNNSVAELSQGNNSTLPPQAPINPIPTPAPAPQPQETASIAEPAVQPPAAITPDKTQTAGSIIVEAPMQGKIVSINVSTGDAVKVGDVVAVLEAMKMENEIIAAEAGTVANVNVSAGQTVEAGDLIITMNA